MANEIGFTFSLTANKPTVMNTPIGMSVTGKQMTMAGNAFIGPSSVSVGTSATVVPVGNVTQPHYGCFYNTDQVNYIQLMNGASGAVLCRLPPGEVWPVPLDPTITLYAIANTAPCIMEYMIVSL